MSYNRLLTIAFAPIAYGLMTFGPGISSAYAECDVGIDPIDFGAVDTLMPEALDNIHHFSAEIDCAELVEGTVTVCLGLNADEGLIRSAGGAALGIAISHASGEWGDGDQGQVAEIAIGENGTGQTDIEGTLEIIADPLAEIGIYSGAIEYTLGWSQFEGFNCASADAEGQILGAVDAEAEVEANCLLDASDLDFGTVGLLTSEISAESTVILTCTPGQFYSVSLDAGLYPTGAGERRMSDGADNFVLYELYQDGARTQIWGEDSNAQSVPGMGMDDYLDVYGLVSPQDAQPPGEYSDVVTVTVQYD